MRGNHERRFDLNNNTHTMIVGAHYQMRLEGRDPAGIDVAALLEALAAAVPVASEQDIITALRHEGVRLITEAEILQQYLVQVNSTGDADD